EHSFAAQDLDPLLGAPVRMNEALDPVFKTNVAAGPLILIACRISFDPPGDPVDLGVPGEHSHYAQALATAAGDLVRRLIEVHALDGSEFAGIDHRPRLPELGIVAVHVSGREENSAGAARLNHSVRLLEARGHRLLAEDRLEAAPRFGAADNDRRIRLDR